MSLTYSDYLKIEGLLNLQQPKSDPAEHDETLFIIIHQVYELWFKLLLHEFDRINRDFAANDLYGALATFKRCRMVMKTLVTQLDVLETMTPLSFLSFRDRLEAASGFQSAQFRELEFLLGYKRPEMLRFHQDSPAVVERLQRRLDDPSVMDCFRGFLAQQAGSSPQAPQSSQEPTRPDEKLQALLLDLYRKRPDLVILFELMTDFDEGFQEWRYRHVKMVERTIGHKQGTGGSAGVDYLRQSLFRAIFPDLWAIRNRL